MKGLIGAGGRVSAASVSTAVNTALASGGPAIRTAMAAAAGAGPLFHGKDAAGAPADLGAAAARTLLNVTEATAPAMTAFLEGVQIAGGVSYTDLAATFASYTAAGGEAVDPATPAEIQKRTAGNIWVTPEDWGASWANVVHAPVAGVITIDVDAKPFHVATSVITQATSCTYDGLDGAERFHDVTASGGDWFFTPTTGLLLGFGGLSGVLIRDGETVRFALSDVGGSVQVRLASRSGDPDAEVVLTPASNAITVSAATVPAKFRTPALSAALTINAGALTGKTIEGRVGPASGADQTVTLVGWQETYGTTDGTFVVPAGKVVKVACEQQNSARIFRVWATSAVARAVPTFVSFAMSSSGAAVTPTSLEGDLALILDGRASASPPDATPGATEIVALTGGIGSGYSLRVSWQAITSDNQTISASGTGSRRLVFIYSGVDLTAPIIATAKNATTTTAASIPALSLPQAGLIVAGIGVDNVTTTPALASPLTVRATSNPSPHTAGDTAGIVTEFAQQDFTLATAEAAIGYAIGLLGKPL